MPVVDLESHDEASMIPATNLELRMQEAQERLLRLNAALALRTSTFDCN